MPGLSLDQAETLVEAAVDELDRFYPVFQFVLWGGKSPKDAIAAAMVGNPRGSMNDGRFWLIGCGNMAGAMLSRWLITGMDPARVTVIDPGMPARQAGRRVPQSPAPDRARLSASAKASACPMFTAAEGQKATVIHASPRVSTIAQSHLWAIFRPRGQTGRPGKTGRAHRQPLQRAFPPDQHGVAAAIQKDRMAGAVEPRRRTRNGPSRLTSPSVS